MSHAAAGLFTCCLPEGQRPRRGVSSGQTPGLQWGESSRGRTQQAARSLGEP